MHTRIERILIRTIDHTIPTFISNWNWPCHMIVVRKPRSSQLTEMFGWRDSQATQSSIDSLAQRVLLGPCSMFMKNTRYWWRQLQLNVMKQVLPYKTRSASARLCEQASATRHQPSLLSSTFLDYRAHIKVSSHAISINTSDSSQIS